MAGLSSLKIAWAALAMVVTAAAVTGCADPKDHMVTGALADDYRQRHPIVLTQAEHNIDIPISAGDRALTKGARDTVRGFAQDYKAHATGTIEILSPQGSYNAAATSELRRQIRRELVAGGIPAPRIVDTFYQAGPSGDAAPIRLRFLATTAVTSACGQWPDDLADRPFDNQNYYNFGCAQQQNLAAQVANPTDLVAPRATSPADTQERAKVIDAYRNGSTPTAAATSFGTGS